MPRPKRTRLDALLVDRGLAPDRRKAAAMVMAGEVIVGDHRVDKAGQAVRLETPGGGGYGAADRRSPAAVARDVARGLISEAEAGADYGTQWREGAA